MAEPGSFGWVSSLARWAGIDREDHGTGGPLPAPKLREPEHPGHDLYQSLTDGWLHGTVGAALSSFFSEPRTRKDLYVLFEKMDMTDIASSFLDLVSEDATPIDPDTGRRLWVTGPEAIVAATEAMLQRLKTEDEITPLARDLAKFGDVFNRLVYRPGVSGGVRRMVPVLPLAVTRVEDKEGRLTGYQQIGKKFKNDNSDTSYAWDFSHFVIRGRDRRYPYGTSLLHSGIRPWKHFLLLDDWVLGYTLSKHPDRNLVLFDGGTGSDAEITAAAKALQRRIRRNIMIDPDGTIGQSMDQRLDPRGPMEDIVLPIRNDSKTSIQKMSGSANAVDAIPLDRAIQRFFSAVRAPKEFFGFAADGTLGMGLTPKASLTNQDIRYARVVQKMQRSLIRGYRYLAELNLTLMRAPGDEENPEVRPADLEMLNWKLDGQDFNINMAQCTFLDEMERLEVDQTRQQVAIAMSELGMNNPAVDIIRWTSYILREVVKVPEDQLAEIIRQDLEPEHIDNMNAGLMPDGSVPGGSGKVAESLATRRRLADGMKRMSARDIDDAIDGDMSKQEKAVLSEAIARSPDLQRVLAQARRVHREGPYDFSAVLPKTDITEGLTDRLDEASVLQMVEESRKEVGLDAEEEEEA